MARRLTLSRITRRPLPAPPGLRTGQATKARPALHAATSRNRQEHRSLAARTGLELVDTLPAMLDGYAANGCGCDVGAGGKCRTCRSSLRLRREATLRHGLR